MVELDAKELTKNSMEALETALVEVLNNLKQLREEHAESVNADSRLKINLEARSIERKLRIESEKFGSRLNHAWFLDLKPTGL